MGDEMLESTDAEEVVIKDYELEEYRLIRAEILQYLEEFQTVRNMMYAVTGVLIGFGVQTGNSYLLLLPLLVIVPSYFIAIDYEKCVNVAATYLKVFYEQKDGFPIRWETRKIYLDLYLSQNSERYITFFNKQVLPYRVSAMVCVLIYLAIWYMNHLSEWAERLLEGRVPSSGVLELLLGIAALIIVFATVFRIKAASFEDCWKAWEKVRDREKINGIAYDAQTVFDEIRRETITVDFLTKMKPKWIPAGEKLHCVKNTDEDSCQEKS